MTFSFFLLPVDDRHLRNGLRCLSRNLLDGNRGEMGRVLCSYLERPPFPLVFLSGVSRRRNEPSLKNSGLILVPRAASFGKSLDSLSLDLLFSSSERGMHFSSSSVLLQKDGPSAPGAASFRFVVKHLFLFE